jgi:hypothetical protein
MSPSSGMKWRWWEVGGIYIGLEEGKAEGVGQSETSLLGAKNPEEHHHPHHRENLKSHMSMLVFCIVDM